jgi:uncharacterized protein (TIGR02145 family)
MKTKVIICIFTLLSALNLKAQSFLNIYKSNGVLVQIPLNEIDSLTHSINNPGDLASLETIPVSNISSTSVFTGGNITNDGGSTVTHRGIAWSLSPNPTTADNASLNGSGLGSYVSQLTGLMSNTTYYIRAYAINSAGTVYGNELSFTTTSGLADYLNPNLNYGTVTDYDGNTYATIVIGTQEWMAENLRTTSYSNGDPIPNVTNSILWSDLSSGAWRYYNENSNNNIPYGKLYNWFVTVDTRNVCPSGWHVPSDEEWSTLINHLDPNANGGMNTNNVGVKLKSTGTQYWLAPNSGVTNSSGFSALPGGYLGAGTGLPNVFYEIRESGYWWTSTGIWQDDSALYRDLNYYVNGIYRNYQNKIFGFSIRCVKD